MHDFIGSIGISTFNRLITHSTGNNLWWLLATAPLRFFRIVRCAPKCLLFYHQKMASRLCVSSSHLCRLQNAPSTLFKTRFTPTLVVLHGDLIKKCRAHQPKLCGCTNFAKKTCADFLFFVILLFIYHKMTFNNQLVLMINWWMWRSLMRLLALQRANAILFYRKMCFQYAG